MQLRISWWEQGLEDEIRTMYSVDPLTHEECTDVEKVQSAARACHSHLNSASAATTEDDADTDDVELPASKRFGYTNNSCKHRMCYRCDCSGHIANACPWQNKLQGDDAPAKDQLDDNVSSQDAATQR